MKGKVCMENCEHREMSLQYVFQFNYSNLAENSIALLYKRNPMYIKNILFVNGLIQAVLALIYFCTARKCYSLIKFLCIDRIISPSEFVLFINILSFTFLLSNIVCYCNNIAIVIITYIMMLFPGQICSFLGQQYKSYNEYHCVCYIFIILL